MSERDSHDEVILAGERIPLTGPVPDSNLKVFQGKVVTGDFTEDSNPILSTYVISDLSGGHGVEELNESLDVARYRLGTLYTRYPKQISKAFAVTDFATSASLLNWRFLGNLKVAGVWDITYSFGTSVDVPGSPPGSLTVEPVNNAVTYRGTSAVNRVVIPMGASGFATVSSAGAFGQRAPVAGTPGTPALIKAVVWDEKLIGIDTDGQLWRTTNPLTSTDNWTSYGPTAKLPKEELALDLVVGHDRNGIPTVYIVTETDVWQFDANLPAIFTVDVSFPPHPHHGLAAAKWNGDLYFSVGIGVHRYTGGSLAAVGLDRDHGLPIEYAGYIVGGGLVAGYNALYAFVTAPDLSSHTFVGDTPTAKSSIHEFTQSGWHMIWESDDEDIVPHSMGISRVDGVGDAFVLFWGTRHRSATAGDDAWLKQMNLPVSFFNPRQMARVTGGFAPGGWLETGIFDANMKGYDKLANAMDIDIETMDDDAVLTVQYKINGAPHWTTLGTVTGTGVTTLPFGTLANGIYPGLIFESIQFRFVLDDDTANAFLMRSAVFSYMKQLPSSWSWELQVDLTSPHILGPEQIDDHLRTIHAAGLMVPLILRGETYRVFVSQISGSVETGEDGRLFRRVSLLEIPLTLANA